jgi:hypothetical protein
MDAPARSASNGRNSSQVTADPSHNAGGRTTGGATSVTAELRVVAVDDSVAPGAAVAGLAVASGAGAWLTVTHASKQFEAHMQKIQRHRVGSRSPDFFVACIINLSRIGVTLMLNV